MDFSKASPRFPNPDTKIARIAASAQARNARLKSQSPGGSSLGATTPQRESDLTIKKQIYSPHAGTSPLSNSKTAQGHANGAAAAATAQANTGVVADLHIGDRVWTADRTRAGTVMFIGQTEFKKGVTWVGIELDPAFQGRHDGVVEGVRYFTCKENQGVFVPVYQVFKMSEDETQSSTHDHASVSSISPGASPQNRRTSIGVSGSGSGSGSSNNVFQSSPKRNSGGAPHTAASHNGTSLAGASLAGADVSGDRAENGVITPTDSEDLNGVVTNLYARLDMATRASENMRGASLDLQVLRDELDGLRSMQTTHETEKEHLKASLDELRAALSEKDDLLSKLEERAFLLEEKHISAVSEDIQAIVDENAALKAEMASLDKRVRQIQAGASDAGATNGTYDSASAGSADAPKWAALQHSMQDLSKSLAVLHDKVGNAGAASKTPGASTSDDAAKSVAEIKASVATMHLESTRAIGDLKAAVEARGATATANTASGEDVVGASLATLQEELARLTSELADAKLDRETFTARAEALQEALAAAQTDILGASAALTDAHAKELEAVRARDTERGAEIHRLESENRKLVDTLNTKEDVKGLASLSHDDAVQKLQDEVADLRSKLGVAEEDKAGLAARLQQALDFTGVVASMQSESERLVAELKTASEERASALTQDVATLRDSQVRLEDQNAKLTAALQQSAAAASHSLGDDAVGVLQRELAALATLVKDSVATAPRTVGEAGVATESLSSALVAEIQTQISRLQESSSLALEEIKSSARQNADLLKESIEAQKVDIAKLEEERAKLAAQVAVGTASSSGGEDDTTKLREELVALRLAAAKAQEEKAAAESLVHRTTEFKEVVEQLRAESQRTIDEVKSAAQLREEALARELASLREKEASRGAVDLSEGIEGHGSVGGSSADAAELERLRDEISRLTSDVQSARREAGAKATTAAVEVKAHQKDVEHLQANLTRAVEDKASLEKSIETLRTTLTQKEEELQATQKELEAARHAAELEKQENVHLREISAKGEAAHKLLETQLAELKTVIEETRAALTSDALTDMARESTEKTSEIERLAKELHQLRDDKAQLTSELRRAESMLFDAEHRLLEVKAANKHVVDFSALAELVKSRENDEILTGNIDRLIAASLEELRRRATVCESQLELLVLAEGGEASEESPFY